MGRETRERTTKNKGGLILMREKMRHWVRKARSYS